MKIKITSEQQPTLLFNNYAVIKGYRSVVSKQELIDIADENSGYVQSVTPLTFLFPDTAKASTDCVEIASFILNIEQVTGLGFDEKLNLK